MIADRPAGTVVWLRRWLTPCRSSSNRCGPDRLGRTAQGLRVPQPQQRAFSVAQATSSSRRRRPFPGWSTAQVGPKKNLNPGEIDYRLGIVECALGYFFKDQSFLLQALNGTGRLIEWNGQWVEGNRRLAIYGDAKMREYLCRQWVGSMMSKCMNEVIVKRDVS
jgi:hypothetical protein